MTLDLAEPLPLQQQIPSFRNERIDRAIDEACGRIAPLWPLRDFIAVNPLMGFADQTFEETCSLLRRIAGAELLPDDVDATDRARGRSEAIVPSVADLLDQQPRLGGPSRLAFMRDEISRWCATYFDEGQAVWRAPSRSLGLYRGWRAAMRYDLNAEAMGIFHFRHSVSSLPDQPRAAIHETIAALDVPPSLVSDYLLRCLHDVLGWAAFARQKSWSAATGDCQDDSLIQLLAVRLSWELALFRSVEGDALAGAWRLKLAHAARSQMVEPPSTARGFHLARLGERERHFQRDLFERMRRGEPSAKGNRPAIQAAFCIDVRSEPIRRTLELVWPAAETIGFAGFFGIALNYVPFGQTGVVSHCPALVSPSYCIHEELTDARPDERRNLLARIRMRTSASVAWAAFKRSAVSSFGYVEAAGLFAVGGLILDALGVRSERWKLGRSAAHGVRLRPTLDHVGGEASNGIAAARRPALAESILRGMSLTERFARLVLLVGHESSSVNNPHAAALDCGACGGHSGEVNARVAADLLNDHEVRAALAARGIRIPEDTWFVAALHDTTTDEVKLLDVDRAPERFAIDVEDTRSYLGLASDRVRSERAPSLGYASDGTSLRRAFARRSRDWSQVRPEWGLAGCAAFIAAPRDATRGMDLGGRVFLHNYDWRTDRNFETLEMIMTAPMVVANWITLQYFASTADNRAFGAGNKALHNIVGGIGVLEGNAGDLRPGLPLQSVHDGRNFVHEPVRMTVLLAAPTEAIDQVIARQADVRKLVDNGWLHLFALSARGEITKRERDLPIWKTWP